MASAYLKWKRQWICVCVHVYTHKFLDTKRQSECELPDICWRSWIVPCPRGWEVRLLTSQEALLWISESNFPGWILASPELLSHTPSMTSGHPAPAHRFPATRHSPFTWLEGVLRVTHLSSNPSFLTDCRVAFDKSFDLFLLTIPPLKNRRNSFWTEMLWW